jgi:hypothetical protein
MSFTLNIIFSGLCLFTQHESKVHVLCPVIPANVDMQRHYAVIWYRDATTKRDTSIAAYGTRVEMPSADTSATLTVPEKQKGLVDLSLWSPKATLDPGWLTAPPKTLGLHVVLNGGGIGTMADSLGRWETWVPDATNPGAVKRNTVVMAPWLSWTTKVDGAVLHLKVGDTTVDVQPIGGTVTLDVRYVVRREAFNKHPPKPDILHHGEKAGHFAAFLVLTNLAMPVPTFDSIVTQTGPEALLSRVHAETRGMSPYTCMVAAITTRP